MRIYNTDIMKKIKFLFFLISSFLTLTATAQNQESEFKIFPFYENGMLMGVQTSPFVSETLNNEKGDIAVGYFRQDGIYALFLKILPNTEMYDAFFPSYEEVMDARYEMVQKHPESYGVFPPKGPVAGVKPVSIGYGLSDGSEYWISGDSRNPVIYNYINVEITEDLDNLPMLLMIAPEYMENKTTGQGGTISEIEKLGLDWIGLNYGVNEIKVKVNRITGTVMKNLTEDLNRRSTANSIWSK